jgi:hypothetical protein
VITRCITRSGLLPVRVCDATSVGWQRGPGRSAFHAAAEGEQGKAEQHRAGEAQDKPWRLSLPWSVCMITPGTVPPRTVMAMASAPVGRGGVVVP